MEDNFCPNLGTRHPKFGKQFGPKSDPILGNKIMVTVIFLPLYNPKLGTKNYGPRYFLPIYFPRF